MPPERLMDSTATPVSSRNHTAVSEEQSGQGRVVVRLEGVRGQEGVQAEVTHPSRLELPEALGQLVAREAVLRLGRVVHDGIADGEGCAGVEAAADGVGQARPPRPGRRCD